MSMLMTGIGGDSALQPLSLQDTFVGSNDTPIQSHVPTPNGGFVWIVVSGSGNIESNALQSATSGTPMLIYAEARSSDGAVGASITLPGSGLFSVGVAARVVSIGNGLVTAYTNDDGVTTYETVVQLGGG